LSILSLNYCPQIIPIIYDPVFLALRKTVNNKMPPMVKATVAMILKVVGPSTIIIQKFITATKKKIMEVMPYNQDFAYRFNIANTP
jgi:hypothetical protein